MTGGYIFTLSTLAGGGRDTHLRSRWGGGGYPVQVLMVGEGVPPGQVLMVPPAIKTWLGYSPTLGWGTPSTIKTWLGYPPPDLGWGTPPTIKTWLGYPPPPTHPLDSSSIASTCYAAGGMPLAFTQEDFLVLFEYSENFGHLHTGSSFLTIS